MSRIMGLDIKRKGSVETIKNRSSFDGIEMFSRNIFNSEKVLETNQTFDLFLDIMKGDDSGDIDKISPTYYTMSNMNGDKFEMLRNKLNNIYFELKTGIDKLDKATDEDLGIKYTLKEEDNKLAIIQSYNKYELDKHYVTKEDEIYNSLSQFKTNREDIGKIIGEKLDKEYNIVREITNGGEENTEYRIKETYLPKVNKTVFVIDKKNIDFNEDREKDEYWETIDMYTDIEALESLSMLKQKNLFKDKKLELKKELDEKDLCKIINLLENPRITEILKNKDYYTFDDKDKPIGLNKSTMEKIGEKAVNVGLFASFLVLNSFKEKNINQNYEIDDKILEKKNIFVKRALNIVSEFEKSNKDIEEFIKTPKSNLVNISAMSLAEIELYEKSQILKPEIRQKLESRKEYLEKFSIIDGLWDKDGEKTDHIETLNEVEALIDLYDGNTSPEQRRLLEMKLHEYSEKHKKEQEEMQKEIRKILDRTEDNALLMASAGIVLGTIQGVSGNGNRIDEELENSTKKYSLLFDMKEYNKEENMKNAEKERKESEKKSMLKFLLTMREAEEKEQKSRNARAKEQNEFSKSGDNEDKNDVERQMLKKLGEKGKKMFIVGNGYLERSADFNASVNNKDGIEEHNEELLKINKAMSIANQNRIDYNMAKTKATVMNINPSGDVFIEMQLLKNSPERIYNDGMSILTMEKTDPINIVDKLIKDNKNSNKENKTDVEKRLSDKVIEKDLKNVPSQEISQKMEITFNDLQKDIIEKDLHQKETYKAIEKITQDKEVAIEKENIVEIDMRTTNEVEKDREKVKEQVKEIEKKIEKQENNSERKYIEREYVEREYVDEDKDKGRDDFER